MQDQDVYNDRCNALTAKLDAAAERLRDATQEKQQQVLDCWDEELFLNIVETVNIYHGGEASFVFRDGSEATVIFKDK